MELNQSNLSKLREHVTTPTYDHQKVKTGIVHIGVGGFHRSHQAYYIQQLLQNENAQQWGICGVGLREADRGMSEVLKKQEYLYTLITQHPDGTDDIEVIGSIKDYLLAADAPNLVIDKMSNPDTKIVSLTITEGGYNFNPTTGAFNFENPDVKHELAHPNEPKTVYGYLTAALRKRKAAATPPFTILSCDNIQHNGDIARSMLLAFAKKQDAELADWIEEHVSFPNTMVDRITPVTSKEVIQHLEKEHGIKDAWPVVCEPFIQWVVEDNYSNGRPPLEKLGVQFVSDVTPYEKMKIRLLNAGHSILGIAGAIHGHPTIDACMQDEVFAKFMRRFMDVEVTPILDVVEGIDLDKYKDKLEERFANPNIKDSVSRICSESSAKLPKFLIPTIIDNLKTGGSIEYGTFLLAAWCYYSDKQTNEKGEALEIIDELQGQLHEAALKTDGNWKAFLGQEEIFGDLVDNERFVAEYEKLVKSIYAAEDIRRLMEGML